MELRHWQSECVSQVLAKYDAKMQHFMCLATPGAGKTIMASEVVNRLFEQDRIDYVLCFSPSIVIATDIRRTMESRIGQRFDGMIGALGASFTYQTMQYLSSDLWHLLKTSRVLVIFDEIHHCAGSSLVNANAWGEKIITNIRDHAAYTLTLSGTPWRSDNAPIALAKYHDTDNRIVCDYAYGLSRAIQDKVCRIPHIVITDNDDITLRGHEGQVEKFDSFSNLLAETQCPYQRIVENEAVIRHILVQASRKLTEIRHVNPNAGGLVVASSVSHAVRIVTMIEKEFGESAVIATYRENEPASIIDEFKASNTRWIVSVGMISEGTNLPRLQVCCHLTRIKTELHFRQILGRILRVTQCKNQEAFLFMPAEATLIEYAYRVADDIPEEKAIVHFEKSEEGVAIDDSDEPNVEAPTSSEQKSLEQKLSDHSIELGGAEIVTNSETAPPQGRPSILTQTYEATLNVFGRFKQEVLAISISPFD